MRKSGAGRIAMAFLTAQVHLEAFLLSPRPYLTALKWRILGKQVRARGQFAPLLARTSRSYQLWVTRRWRKGRPSPPALPTITALVLGEADVPGTAEAICSFAREGIAAIPVGTAAADLASVLGKIAGDAEPWLCFPAPGDRIAPGAAAAYRNAMAGKSTCLIYTDDDLVTLCGGFHDAPHFKPDWNLELLRHHDFLTGAAIIRTRPEALAAAAAMGPGGPAHLIADAIARSSEVVHIPQVLHHRAARPAPSLPLSPLPIAPDLTPVSAIIPTRNRVDLLSTCLAGLEAADYPEIEAIVVDNDSDDPATLEFLADLPTRSRPGRRFRVLRHPGPFNYSAINNRAVAEATGEVICLLNNDIEMRLPDWLKIMATQALRDDVGAVGAQLLYPDGRIQHAGVVIGVGNAAGHAHRFLRPEDEGYFRRHALPQFISAVTAACLVVKRERFLAVGGLDDVSFPVAFNDVDLCLKLNQRGWQSFYEPRAVLTHHESVSRGFDTDPVGAARFAGELAALQQRWQTDRIVDPYHHPQLSRASEQFAIAL